MSDVTRIPSQIESGDPQAAEQLLPLVYDELRRLAAEKMREEKPGQTLQATALAHEAYIQLVDVEKAQHWNSRRHFFASAAEAMRRILVERARRKGRAKHGGGCVRFELDEALGVVNSRDEEVVALDDALQAVRHGTRRGSPAVGHKEHKVIMKGEFVKPVVLITVFLAMARVGLAQRTDVRIEMDVNHLDRITRANARVAAKKASVDSDPAKPIFHIMPAAGSAGDPNGVIYAKGKYHVFFQHAPEFEWGKPAEEWEEGQPGYSNTGWGHASSEDLVHWEHEPIALMPERGSYDPNFCASGCTVVADDGTPTIFYTAAEPQTQCIARSRDPNLRWWLKDANNPILLEPEVDDYVKGGFRDPFIWREGSTWQMIVCGGVQGVGGTVLYFRSENLTDWEYVRPLCTGMGEHCLAWECPNFLLFGDIGVLIVSPLFNNLQDTDHAPRGAVSYTIAPYKGNGNFTPGPWKSLDIGGPNNFYASNAMKAPDGRWLLWGMNLGGGAPGHHWTTKLSLPRVITLRPDGLLGNSGYRHAAFQRRRHRPRTFRRCLGTRLDLATPS